MSVDTDDDEVGLTEGMEPESPTGDDPDDDGAESEFEAEASRALAHQVDGPVRGRAVSDKTRELFKELSQKARAAVKDDPDDDDIEYDEVPPDAAKPLATAQVTSPPETGAKGEPAAPSPAAPAPSLDPDVAKMREDYTAKLTELGEREKRVVESERGGDIPALIEQVQEQGIMALVPWLRTKLGLASDEDFRQFVADATSEMSNKVLGVDVPTDYLEKISNRRAVKSVKAIKESIAKQETERATKLKQAQDEENTTRIKGILTQELTKPENAQSYPFLAAEENPGALVFDVVEAQRKKDGTQLTYDEAAKRANEYLKHQASAWFDKRKHLLTAAPASAGGESNGKQAQQGDPQVRRSRAQTPPPETSATPTPNTGKWDPEAHRRAIKQKHRAAFRPPE